MRADARTGRWSPAAIAPGVATALLLGYFVLEYVYSPRTWHLLPFDSFRLVGHFPLLALGSQSEGTLLAMEVTRVTFVDHLVHGTSTLSAETGVTASSISAGQGRVDRYGGWRRSLSAEIR